MHIWWMEPKIATYKGYKVLATMYPPPNPIVSAYYKTFTFLEICGTEYLIEVIWDKWISRSVLDQIEDMGEHLREDNIW